VTWRLRGEHTSISVKRDADSGPNNQAWHVDGCSKHDMFTEENLPGEFHVYVDTDSSTNEDVGLQADIQLCLHALVWGE